MKEGGRFRFLEAVSESAIVQRGGFAMYLSLLSAASIIFFSRRLRLCLWHPSGVLTMMTHRLHIITLVVAPLSPPHLSLKHFQPLALEVTHQLYIVV